jgi:hypothetical protein
LGYKRDTRSRHRIYEAKVRSVWAFNSELIKWEADVLFQPDCSKPFHAKLRAIVFRVIGQKNLKRHIMGYPIAQDLTQPNVGETPTA